MSVSSSNFANSHNVLHDATFITAQNYFNGRSYSNGDEAFKLLREHIAEDALHNSDERCDAPKCLPETRIAVQEEILSWITAGDTDEAPKLITWLSGPAGSGKTAIAGTIAEICEERGLLAGSFFFSSFSGSERRQSKRCLVATLAYCVLQHDGLQALRATILSSIERDPAIFSKRLKDQCGTLLVKPFHGSGAHFNQMHMPKVIIIDGLDEVTAGSAQQCTHKDEPRTLSEDHQVEILSTLLQAANDASFPFRLLISSRPERAIREFFSEDACDVTKEIFLDGRYHPDSDITLFLTTKFGRMRRRYRLPSTWPAEDVLDALVEKASGQFIYAATVVRFLERGGLPPQLLLKNVLKLGSGDHARSAFATLDSLYTHILMSSPDPLLSVRWLGVILGPLRTAPALFVRQFLSDFDGQASYLLENLVSLIKIPSPEKEHTFQYEVYHKSLVDFLESERCGEDFYKAFSSGESLFHQRASEILASKSTVVELPDSALRTFCADLLLLHVEIYSPFNTYGPAFPQYLAQCDIAWWIDILNDVLPRTPSFPRSDLASELVVRLFDLVHNRCVKQAPIFQCHDDCKDWRGRIFQACQSGGWSVPASNDLLREMMCNNLEPHSHTEGYFRGCFQIPIPVGPEAQPETLAAEDYITLLRRAQTELKIYCNNFPPRAGLYRS